MKLKEFYTDKSKWAQNEFYNGRGAYCLVGALQKCYPIVSGIMSGDSLAKRLKVYAKIEQKIDACSSRGIVSWNDAPERTFEEVKALVEELDI